MLCNALDTICKSTEDAPALSVLGLSWLLSDARLHAAQGMQQLDALLLIGVAASCGRP